MKILLVIVGTAITAIALIIAAILATVCFWDNKAYERIS